MGKRSRSNLGLRRPGGKTGFSHLTSGVPVGKRSRSNVGLRRHGAALISTSGGPVGKRSRSKIDLWRLGDKSKP